MYHLNRLIKLRVDVNLSNINYLKDFIRHSNDFWIGIFVGENPTELSKNFGKDIQNLNTKHFSNHCEILTKHHIEVNDH